MPDSKNELVNEAIDASIEFEELMDKTDFDSWLETDNKCSLKKLGQQINPFVNYEKNKKLLINICDSMRNRGDSNFPNLGDKSSLEKFIIYNLFESKNKRTEARICSNKEDEEGKYKQSRYHLLSALYALNNPKAAIIDHRWLILIYNDLSICYAGLERSSMSRGYAIEARMVIEKHNREFIKIIGTENAKISGNVEDNTVLSNKLFDLYTIAIFNQALSEKRSHLYADAERNFKKIFDYVVNYPNLNNFNYYSALLNLSDLYIDLGRGEEAIELLNIVEYLDEDDIRYWNASLTKINSFIDQSEYCKSEKLLLNKFIKKEKKEDKDIYTLKRRHRVTSQGFKALNYYFRCMIKKERNKLNKKINNDVLRNAYKFIYEHLIEDIEGRKQKGLARKAYRQLSDIATILEEQDELEDHDDVIKYIIKFLSYPESDIEDLQKFVSNEVKMNNWINDCDDLDVLEKFVFQILTRNKKAKYKKLLELLKDKIVNECEEKGQLLRAEKIVKKIDIALEIRKGVPFKESSFKGIKNTLTDKDIVKRLDINEKQFDMVLYERKNIIPDHIIELILLRRWNSFTPGLFREGTGSLGGGYFLRINKGLLNANHLKGSYINENNGLVDIINRKEKDNSDDVMNIVIDPGYNFLHNFRKEGFFIDDIDTIVVTHSHLDHSAETLQIMELIYQINKRYKDTPRNTRERKKVKLCLSQGAYTKLSSHIPDWKMQLKDVIILENLVDRKCKPFKDLDLTISSIQTHHMDLGGVNAIGLRIDIGIGKEKNLCIGFTGDTPWYDEIKDDFIDCDILCVHLGSIMYQEIGYKDDRYNSDYSKRIIEGEEKKDEFKRIYEETNHLLYYGTELLIEDCVKKDGDNLIIVSEFGEELKYGLRTDVCKRLSQITNIKCIPGDIGLCIGANKQRTIRVRCNYCEEFIAPKEIETFSYGLEDALHYICQTCQNTLSELQKEVVIEHRITRH